MPMDTFGNPLVEMRIPEREYLHGRRENRIRLFLNVVFILMVALSLLLAVAALIKVDSADFRISETTRLERTQIKTTSQNENNSNKSFMHEDENEKNLMKKNTNELNHKMKANLTSFYDQYTKQYIQYKIDQNATRNLFNVLNIGFQRLLVENKEMTQNFTSLLNTFMESHQQYDADKKMFQNRVNQSLESVSLEMRNLIRDNTALILNQTSFIRKELHYSVGWYDPVNGYVYKLTSDLLTWNKSRHRCQDIGGDLAVVGVQNMTTRTKIANALSITTGTWIGLSDINDGNSFVWIDGSVSTRGNTHWLAGEPNGGTSENCGDIHTAVPGYKTNDASCLLRRKALCEKRLN